MACLAVEGAAFTLPSMFGPPGFPGAALRFASGPRTGEPCLRRARSRPPCGRPLRARRSFLTSRRLTAAGRVRARQRQIRLRRAGSGARGIGSSCGWSVVGFRVVVGCGCGALLTWPQRQPGTCREHKRRGLLAAKAVFYIRRLFSRQNPGRATPARRGEHHNLGGVVALRSTVLCCGKISHRALPVPGTYLINDRCALGGSRI